MPSAAGGWLCRYVKKMPDAYSGAGAIAHSAQPIAHGCENLRIICDRHVRLVEPLWIILEITKGLPCLVLVRVEHAHPQIDGSVFLIGIK